MLEKNGLPFNEKFTLEKSSDTNYDALGGTVPAAGHPPVAIVPYYLYVIVGKFPVQLIPGHRNAPPPPTGAGLAQGRQSSLEKRISTEQKN